MTAELPEILAGPIVRRVESKRVCIWIAVSKPYRIQIKIYQLQKYKAALNIPEVPVPLGSGTIEKPTKLGDNLYVALVITTPKPSLKSAEKTSKMEQFPTGEILAYDIELKEEESTSVHNLASLLLVDGEHAITYRNKGRRKDNDEDAPLPTFFIPKSDSQCNFVHASCRKLHGERSDAMQTIDTVIRDNVTKVSRRPSTLLLTGDQIYADDVSKFLIKHLTTLGIRLLGKAEHIPGIPDVTTIAVGGRKDVAKKQLGFTSAEAGNHLFTYGEFVAMYLVAWNLKNWPPGIPDFPIRREDRKKLEKDREELENIHRAKKAMHAVRRVLANIATYMIFDDHEITDDWNLTMESYMKTLSNKAATRIILNGIVAYWYFQAWGNDPDKYDESFRHKLHDYVEAIGDRSVDHKMERDLFVELNPCMLARPLLKIKNLLSYHGRADRWSFVTATDPPIVFLDTRTQRQYDSERGAARLLSEGLLSWLVRELSLISTRSKDLIIVSPTPVIGFEFEETVREWASENVINPYITDLEAWSANPAGYFEFIKKIMEQVIPEPDCIIFLSGDVHYANTAFTEISLLRNGNKYRLMRFYQLTSSAIKNTDRLHRELVDRLRFLQGRRGVIGSSQHFLDTELLGYVYPLSDPVLREIMEEGRIRRISKSIFLSRLAEPNNYALMIRSDNPRVPAIRAKPAWSEFRRYYVAGQYGNLVVGDNNIGLINLDRTGRSLSHRLCVPDKGKSFDVRLRLPSPT